MNLPLSFVIKGSIKMNFLKYQNFSILIFHRDFSEVCFTLLYLLGGDVLNMTSSGKISVIIINTNSFGL